MYHHFYLELAHLSGRTTNVTVIAPKDIQLLKSQEIKLENLNNQIRDRTQELEGLVLESMKNSQNNEFAISAVNFEIESLRLKIDYLKKLRENSNTDQTGLVKNQFDKYFSDLKTKFNQQNSLIDDLNEILKNFNEIGQLRAKISNLKSKIEIANLMIEQKQACSKERDQIKKFQRNDHEIKSLMSNLREKKKDKNNINNKYCEGVVKKLQDRVKKVLLSYDYTFQCAEGLEDLINQKNNDQQDLLWAENRLKELQGNAGINDYKRKFEQNRQYMKNKQDELQKLNIANYQHDINELNQLINNAESELLKANNRKRQLGTPNGNGNVDFTKIQDLVAKIKKLKGIYCQEYEKYDSKAQGLWKQVQKYETEVEYSSKIRGIYEEEINELRDLESTFDLLRSKILQRIQ